MHLVCENEGIEGNRFVVTGGLGFVGSALCSELIRRGADEVRTLDPRTSSPWSDHLNNLGVRFIQGDVRKKKDVEKAVRGATCVFHLASYGMSGKEMLQAGRIDEVNINGTCHVLDACLDFGIKRLIYVSTYNVVFGGKEIVNGNEGLPYFPIDDHVDPYGRSKSIAEQLVLKSNGRQSKKKNGTCLYTCVIRPAAIYGPGEERHFPRIVSYAKLGLFAFRIGDASVKTDWVYLDNLVLALILASMGLLDDIPGKEGRPVAAGQPYFICDGSPINTFEFMRPLFKSLEYELPNATLGVSHALFLGRIFWVLYTFFYPWLNRSWLPQPFILPAEVYKVGVTHYCSYLKAKKELGYVPVVSPQEEGGCGYGDLHKISYGKYSAGLSGLLFERGRSCGSCYEVRCVNHIHWCLVGSPSIIVTATDFCPPNYGLANDYGGWCNFPRKHFEMSEMAFAEIAIRKADIVQIQYRRVNCDRSGGMRFTLMGTSYFYQVLVTNVGLDGVVSAVKVKGSRTGWLSMGRNWGQIWQCNTNLHGQPLSFEVTTSSGRSITSYNVAPKHWQFGQTFEGKQF